MMHNKRMVKRHLQVLGHLSVCQSITNDVTEHTLSRTKKCLKFISNDVTLFIFIYEVVWRNAHLLQFLAQRRRNAEKIICNLKEINPGFRTDLQCEH